MNHFNLRAASNLKFLIFHVHTPSRNTEKKQMSYTIKIRKNEKLGNGQPSSLMFSSRFLKVPTNHRERVTNKYPLKILVKKDDFSGV